MWRDNGVMFARGQIAALLASTSVLGCGRLGFEAIADDTVPIGCTATGAEVCDGVDNDCDLMVDEGCTCGALGYSGGGLSKVTSFPGLASTGSGVAVLVENAGDPTLVQIDGSVARPPIPLVLAYDTSVAGRGPLVWDGETFAAVISHPGGTYYARFAPGGSIAVEAAISVGSNMPRGVWNGAEIGLVTLHPVSDVMGLHALAPDGTIVGTSLRQNEVITPQAVAWDGSRYLLSWLGTGPAVRLAWVSHERVLVLGPVDIGTLPVTNDGTGVAAVPVAGGVSAVIGTSPSPKWIRLGADLDSPAATTLADQDARFVNIAAVGSQVAYARWVPSGGNLEARISLLDPDGALVAELGTLLVLPAATAIVGGISLLADATSITAAGLGSDGAEVTLFVRRICL
jgi:hypothetical protein